jgi:hypothetical protein
LEYQHRGQAPKETVVQQPKKPTREQCKKLVGRLLGLPFAPSVQQPIEVLIDALQKSAESIEHATAVIDAFALGECERCPSGYELMQKAGELRTVERRPDPDCRKCFGSGFETVIKGGYSGSAKCDCWRPVLKEIA